MAQKFKNAPSVPLPLRIQKARREGRTQQALDLARQLYKQDPTAENLDLLRWTTFERGAQLCRSGYVKDAATVLGNCIDMGGPPEFQLQLAEKLTACGAPQLAAKLMSQLSDADRAKILVHTIDGAMRAGAAGRAQLSAELHAQFDLIVQAFVHAERGEDDAARAALQGIGLQSPFLEWKVLLRGLLAWYANDDARALENWQRLDSKRLPFRIAAPFRAQIDAVFRNAQSSEAQQGLRRLAEQASGSGFAQPLLVVQQILSRGEVRNALRQAEGVLPALRRDHPSAAVRLGQVFFWAIVDKGEPSDVPRLIRLFGAPPDDPRLLRLEALAAEKRQIPDEAQEFWSKYEQQVQAHPEAWPGGQSQRVRAILWEHMGHATPPSAVLSKVQALALNRGGLDFKMLPAEECFRRSIALAPDRLEPHEAMLRWHLELDQKAEAMAVGRKLLEHFPNHAPTLSTLGRLHQDKQEYEAAQTYIERAVKANPLDADLRLNMTWIHQVLGVQLLAERGKHDVAERVDQARKHYETALQYQDRSKTLIRCRFAVLEMLAGQPERAAAHIAEALATPHQRLAVAHDLNAESTRVKVPAPKKKALLALATRTDATADLPRTAEAPLEVHALVEAARILHHYPAYRAQKTEAKKAVQRVTWDLVKQLPETHLANLCDWLNELKADKQVVCAFQIGQRRFPKNPVFLLAEAEHGLGKKNSARSMNYRFANLLENARRLTVKLPRELQESIMQRIEYLEDKTGRDVNPLSMLEQMMGEAFDAFGGGFDEDGFRF